MKIRVVVSRTIRTGASRITIEPETTTIDVELTPAQANQIRAAKQPQGLPRERISIAATVIDE